MPVSLLQEAIGVIAEVCEVSEIIGERLRDSSLFNAF